MEINITGTVTSSTARTTALKQAEDAHQFSKTLEQIQSRISTLGKSKIAGKTMREGIRELGILGYAREKHIDALRVQIREQVLHDIGITAKQYQNLRTGINNLHASPYLSQKEIDRLNKMSDNLDDEIEIEVERRLREHLEAEAKAGMLILNTLAYDKGSEEYKGALAKLRDMLGKVRTLFDLDSALGLTPDG